MRTHHAPPYPWPPAPGATPSQEWLDYCAERDLEAMQRNSKQAWWIRVLRWVVE
jgi:hypothetical protein